MKAQTGTTNLENHYLEKLKILFSFGPATYSQLYIQNSVYQSMILKPTASISTENLLEIQIVGHDPRSTESELGWWSLAICVYQALQGIPMQA